jgi:hypothetical protein
MADELKFPEPGSRPKNADRDALDARLASIVRSAYAPPVGSGGEDRYWAGVELRIMAGIAAGADTIESGRYWGVLGRWAQGGLVAAVALLAVAGIVNTRIVDSDDQSQYAYEEVVRSTSPESVSATTDLMSSTDAAAARDATLRYVLSH